MFDRLKWFYNRVVLFLKRVLMVVGVLVLATVGLFLFWAMRAGSGEAVPTLAVLPSVTFTPSVTPTVTATATATATATVTPTYTPSHTATVTLTPTYTPTRSPEDVARDAYREAMGRSRLDDLDRLIVNERIVTIRFALGSFPITTAETFYPQLVCELRGAGLTGRTYQITGTVNLVDNFGNVFEGEGVEMILYWDTISQINCGSPHNVNLPAIADRWDVHPALD